MRRGGGGEEAEKEKDERKPFFWLLIKFVEIGRGLADKRQIEKMVTVDRSQIKDDFKSLKPLRQF